MPGGVELDAGMVAAVCRRLWKFTVGSSASFSAGRNSRARKFEALIGPPFAVPLLTGRRAHSKTQSCSSAPSWQNRKSSVARCRQYPPRESAHFCWVSVPGNFTSNQTNKLRGNGRYDLPFGASPLQAQFRPSFGSPDPEYWADCGYGHNGRVSPFAPRPSSCVGVMPCSTHSSIACVESKPLSPGPPRQCPMPGNM